MGFAKLSLKGRALKLLAQREHSRSELESKLARHVEEGDDLAAILDELESKDFINSERVAASVVHRRASRMGTQRVVQELRSKGLDDALIKSTAAELQSTELERALQVWKSKFGSREPANTPQEKAKQMRFLAARGFSGDVVRKVLKSAAEIEDGEGSCFE
ncbi:recombination regulator RecX [Diaphorobacter sp. HDW4B]|uniref:recombination regulator RecX n=1 Tax=Diaphorobacter sp. HDW4B TaxID=2714925 RepID=UPI0014099D1C|nr:recombination regulator RecX [Diaphorobacter sp. HDW4B]QIL71201.1 recombination regulator RecX [Diaphorobacter sp. HDW4B]